jgi:3-oxoadipate enol-lactonase
MNTGIGGRSGIAWFVADTDAPAIVFVNSLGTDHRMWDAQVAALGSAYRTVCFDSCGHGQSRLPQGSVTIERIGGAVLDLLDLLEVDRAWVCGCSMGGQVTLWLAAMHPERTRGAVLANTGARLGTIESWNARIAAVQGGGMAAVRDLVVGRFLSAGLRSARPDIADTLAQTLERVDPRGYVAACEAIRDADLRAVAPGVMVPTLVVAGSLDESTPVAMAEGLHASIPGSRLVVIPGAAHLSMVERPDVFNAHLLEFLRATAA